MDYADAGVDYAVLDRFKRACMAAATKTQINLYRGRPAKDSYEVAHMLRLMSRAED